MSEENNKKVFISYSWTTPNHERWVLELAERLVDNGVDVVLDKWDLAEGQDKYAFMEKMVQDETINKVLIICDKGYKDKANDRAGGVGTETQIITPMIYSKAEETKFIPIIAQKGEKEFDEYMPHYLKSRIGIVMSCEESYMKGFEQLLRAIYDKPMFKKPKLGKKPSFLEAESKVTSGLYFINESLKRYINDNRKSMIEYTINDFKEKFFEELNSFIIDSENLKEPYDEQIIEAIDGMKEIRDEYLCFIENLIFGYESFNSELIIEFFEKIFAYSEYKGSGNSYTQCITEHFEFIITEMFIWTNILLFKYKKYTIIHEILCTKYLIKSKYKAEPIFYVGFRFSLESMEYRNSRMQLNRVSITADKLIERAIYKGKDYKDELVDIDLILYYISKSNKAIPYEWFPVTYVYKECFDKVEFISKLIRKKHFEDVKVLFNVNTVEDMKKLIKTRLSDSERGFQNSWSLIPGVKEYINIDEIATF